MQRSIVSRFAFFFSFVYIAAGFALFLSVADNYLSKSGSLPLPPTVAAVVFLISIIGVVALRDFLSRRATLSLSLIARANLAVILPFLLLAFLSLLLSLHPEAYWGEGQKWIYLQAYDFCIFMGAMLLPAVTFVRQRFQLFVIFGLLTLLGSIWYEVNNPGTFSTVTGRAAGFPSNSNWAALVSVMVCAMSLSYRDGPWRILDLLLLGLTGGALYFTLSRSGTINFLLLLLFYSGTMVFASAQRVRTVLSLLASLVCLLAFFFIVVPMISKGSALMSGSKAQNRLLALVEGEIVDDGSASDRMHAARETFDRIEHSPLIGNGTGFNRRMRQTPHNIYLKLWVDSGILGVLSWLLLLFNAFWTFTARKYRPGQALILATFFGGFFSHNILEQRTFLLLLGCAATMSLYQSARAVCRTASVVKYSGLVTDTSDSLAQVQRVTS